MTSEEIKEIRNVLNLTQEELAIVLGVTKTSVARYEMKGGPKPQGDVARKIAHLHVFISDPSQKKRVKNMRVSGGVASIAAILAIGVATFPVSAAAAGAITIEAILKTPASVFLGSLLGGSQVMKTSTNQKKCKFNKN